jgi:hypothetical protein
MQPAGVPRYYGLIATRTDSPRAPPNWRTWSAGCGLACSGDLGHQTDGSDDAVAELDAIGK